MVIKWMRLVIRIILKNNPQEINRYYAASYSAYMGIPVYFVTNEEGKVEQTVEQVKKILEGL